MSKLPQVSGKQMMKVLEKVGFVEVRVRGSHHHFKKDGNPLIITVPNHSELKRGTLGGILSSAEISRDEFIALIDG